VRPIFFLRSQLRPFPAAQTPPRARPRQLPSQRTTASSQRTSNRPERRGFRRKQASSFLQAPQRAALHLAAPGRVRSPLRHLTSGWLRTGDRIAHLVRLEPATRASAKGPGSPAQSIKEDAQHKKKWCPHRLSTQTSPFLSTYHVFPPLSLIFPLSGILHPRSTSRIWVNSITAPAGPTTTLLGRHASQRPARRDPTTLFSRSVQL
jgi:hypothetical protein